MYQFIKKSVSRFKKRCSLKNLLEPFYAIMQIISQPHSIVETACIQFYLFYLLLSACERISHKVLKESATEVAAFLFISVHCRYKVLSSIAIHFFQPVNAGTCSKSEILSIVPLLNNDHQCRVILGSWKKDFITNFFSMPISSYLMFVSSG